MWKTTLGWLRGVGYLEGLSFLILLGIAMPLKYFADLPDAVAVVGMAHGVLFVLYLAVIAYALIVRHLTLKNAVLAVAAAFLPFGPFLLDRRLRRA
jgi:integral membrane protein